MYLGPDGVFTLHTYRGEDELEKFIVQNSLHVFGRRPVCFDVKHRVESKVKAKITDGLLLDLNGPDEPRFWIVEVELSKHDPYKDVEPQVHGFLRALKGEGTLSVIANTLYEELRKERHQSQSYDWYSDAVVEFLWSA